MCKPYPCGSIVPNDVTVTPKTLRRLLLEKYIRAWTLGRFKRTDAPVRLLDTPVMLGHRYLLVSAPRHDGRTLVLLCRSGLRRRSFVIGERAFLTTTMYTCCPEGMIAIATGMLRQAQPDL